MKIAVCMKEVLDSRLPIQVTPQATVVQVAATRERVTVVNPADRSALESAINLRTRMQGGRLEAFSVCGPFEASALYFALARGADGAERLESDPPYAGPPFTAVVLAARFQQDDFDLVCCGDETLDNSSAVVGPLIAEILGWAQVTGVVRIVEVTPSSLILERSLERGHRELVDLKLPGLVTFKAHAAGFRYVSFRKLQQVTAERILVRRMEIDPAEWKLPQWPAISKNAPPRARVKKTFVPSSKISPADRVKMIMSGGMAPLPLKDKSSVVDGDAEYLSEQIFRFLRHQEFI